MNANLLSEDPNMNYSFAIDSMIEQVGFISINIRRILILTKGNIFYTDTYTDTSYRSRTLSANFVRTKPENQLISIILCHECGSID